jgi:hypothetical protein
MHHWKNIIGQPNQTEKNQKYVNIYFLKALKLFFKARFGKFWH